MQSIRPLYPLLMTAGILLAGNGLQGTAIALRGAQEGFSATLIAYMGTAYFAGFILGCIYAPKLLKEVGHIRVFSALAAIAASGTILLVMWVDAFGWILLRLLMGFCFSGLFTTVESWINSNVTNKDRAQVLSIYRIIDLLAVTGGQFMLPIFGVSGFTLFAIMAMMSCLSLVPVSLGDRSSPKPPPAYKFEIGTIWNLSPLACLGCVTIGMTNSAFRLVGPLYAQDIGLSIANVAAFMSAGIVGGAALQYPLGKLSDQYDRRNTLIAATLGAVASGLFLSFVAGNSALLNYVGIFLFGAFALPLYSLSAAHANDRANDSNYVLISASLMFFFSVGAMIGPVLASFVMGQFGARALFTYTSVVHGLLVLMALWRIQARDAVPERARSRFTGLLRTSPILFRAAKKRKAKSDKQRP